MAVNPQTGIEDPLYIPPNKGLVDGVIPTNTASATTAQTANTTQLNSGSVSEQLDQILGNSTVQPGPTSWNVNDNQTVQGQIKGIIDTNSPLMQQAKATANESSNARGLINSSMATEAGQAALYSAALPIAQQDASTYAAAGQFNAAETNKMNMQLIDDQNKIELANINTSYQGLVAANQGAATLYDTYQRAINAILTNQDMAADTKQQAINLQLSMMQSGMAMYSDIQGLNIADMLDFSSEAATANTV